MFRFDELVPSFFDIDGIAVVGSFIDEDAQIVVACLVGIVVEQLRKIVSDYHVFTEE